MLRIVVFDANILLSGTIWRGKPHDCLDLARKGVLDGVTCPEILAEVDAKLTSKFGFTNERTIAVLAELLEFLRPVAIDNTLRAVSADPDDNKIVECAVVAGATHIITGDRRHLLPMRRFRSIEIVSAAEFLAQIVPERQ